jgi:hypothetical protein
MCNIYSKFPARRARALHNELMNDETIVKKISVQNTPFYGQSAIENNTYLLGVSSSP